MSTPQNTPQNDPGKPVTRWRSPLFLLIFIGLAMLVVGRWSSSHLKGEMISYGAFKQHLENGEINHLVLEETELYGKLNPGVLPIRSIDSPEESPPGPKSEKEANEPTPFQAYRVDDRELVAKLDTAKVDYRGIESSGLLRGVLSWVIPLFLIFFFWGIMSRASGAGQGGPMGSALGFGRSKAKLIPESNSDITFGDIAGCDEAKVELAEVVDFLKSPERYAKLGAKVPTGVLLIGPPGTGKTLMARAVAGEAGVSFFSISGSAFTEMFVGVGAARVRDLFEQARKHAPTIVFIDELDAIGRQRGAHPVATNDEREQTLDQLLVELDGFEKNSGVIVLSATNRPDVLDPALLRPGRFDRQVLLDTPDRRGRFEILKIHARNKLVDEDVNLEEIAQQTPGLSGADLANVLNEAALLAAREGADRIHHKHVGEAVEKTFAGPQRKSRTLRPKDRKRVAYHEVGHALVGHYSEHADRVHKISIIPRGPMALGYTLQLPDHDVVLRSQPELEDQLRGLLGGRVAEKIIYGTLSTGAENDLQQATVLARKMVCLYGMNPTIGPVRCAQREQSPFLQGASPRLSNQDCSDETVRQIDIEVRKLVSAAETQAQILLESKLNDLKSVSEALYETESLTHEEFVALLPAPSLD